MSSTTSAQNDYSRLRLSTALLLVFLVLTRPGVLQAQRTAARSSARQQGGATVPRVIGLLADEAVRTLRDQNFTEEMLQRPVITLDSVGRVTVQKPDSGQRLAPGGRVSIWIGQDAGVSMPRVQGLPLLTARERLRASGIDTRRILLDSVEAPSSIDSVVKQRPESGSIVHLATRILLTQAVRPPTETSVVVHTPVSPDYGASLRWLAPVGFALLIAVASAFGAPAIWPPPQVDPGVDLQPLLAEVAGASRSLVDVSVGFRFHIEHGPSTFDPGSSLE